MLMVLPDGTVTLLDDDVCPIIGTFKWYLHGRYVSAGIKRDGVIHNLRLHHLILPREVGLVCDHINGNTLDNRRANLRNIPQAMNILNQQKVRGVRKHHSGKYQAYGNKNYVHVHIGTFATYEEALSARKTWEKEQWI